MSVVSRSAGRSDSRRTVLSVDRLEARDVPSATVVDLTTRGATGSVGGALFAQAHARPAPAGELNTFVRLDADCGRTVEQGYNTDARRPPYDAVGGRRATHALRVADTPAVTVDGVRYREFRLDVREGWRSRVSLDELRVYVSDDPAIAARLRPDGTLPDAALAYDMDAGGDTWVKLDGRLSTARRPVDMVLNVPEAALRGGEYLYLYSKFGVNIAATGGAEAWAVQGPGGGPVAPPAGPATFTGTVSFQGLPVTDPGLTVVLLRADGTAVSGVTVEVSNGAFTITGVPPGDYIVTATLDLGYDVLSGSVAVTAAGAPVDVGDVRLESLS